MSHALETIQSIYAAFGRGDIPAILAQLADDVAWEQWPDHRAQQAGVPWLQERRGQDEEIHLWTLNPAGQVSGFRHYIDTAKHIELAKLL